jgi:hypothetical protein
LFWLVAHDAGPIPKIQCEVWRGVSWTIDVDFTRQNLRRETCDLVMQTILLQLSLLTGATYRTTGHSWSRMWALESMSNTQVHRDALLKMLGPLFIPRPKMAGNFQIRYSNGRIVLECLWNKWKGEQFIFHQWASSSAALVWGVIMDLWWGQCWHMKTELFLIVNTRLLEYFLRMYLRCYLKVTFSTF